MASISFYYRCGHKGDEKLPGFDDNLEACLFTLEASGMNCDECEFGEKDAPNKRKDSGYTVGKKGYPKGGLWRPYRFSIYFGMFSNDEVIPATLNGLAKHGLRPIKKYSTASYDRSCAIFLKDMLALHLKSKKPYSKTLQPKARIPRP